jgi:hypothetical protein
MSIYIASMNMRGKWANCPDNALKLNVTSCQSKKSIDRITFSPMNLKEYKGFACFENYWQSGKVWEHVEHETTLRWWKKQTLPKRRYPNSKSKSVLYAKWEHTKELNYIESRRLVYVPEYYNMIKSSERIKVWKEKIKNGNDVIVYDIDGPRDKNGNPICLKLDLKLLRKKFLDTSYPFGHGYIVAATICGYKPDDYTNIVENTSRAVPISSNQKDKVHSFTNTNRDTNTNREIGILMRV